MCWIRVHLFTGGIQNSIPFVYRRIQDPFHLIAGGIQDGIKDPGPFVSWGCFHPNQMSTLDKYPSVSKAVINIRQSFKRYRC